MPKDKQSANPNNTDLIRGFVGSILDWKPGILMMALLGFSKILAQHFRVFSRTKGKYQDGTLLCTYHFLPNHFLFISSTVCTLTEQQCNPQQSCTPDVWPRSTKKPCTHVRLRTTFQLESRGVVRNVFLRVILC
jgi:hypothetical protein